jgi:transcriptional regulator with XRE-family HTH domain
VYFTRKRVIFTKKKLCIFESMEASTKQSNSHIGRKISRIRELRGIKQEHLASELGVSQQSISRMEQSEVLEDEVLEKVAKVLGVTADAIKNFSEDAVFNYFNTFNDNSFSNSNGTFHANNCTFNPIDKLVELFEENKKLYERLLQSEREKVELLKQNKN